MAIKSEIAWTKRLEDGTKVEVYARRHGGEWTFHRRGGRHDLWINIEEPDLEDWEALLEAVKRRVPRRLYPPDEVRRIEATMRERFPTQGPVAEE